MGSYKRRLEHNSLLDANAMIVLKLIRLFRITSFGAIRSDNSLQLRLPLRLTSRAPLGLVLRKTSAYA